ncbi:hypothetical protein [Xanthomonas phage Xp15]|uniref:Uncharacterized protein n=1 Tax=Xanthomonas phage Xp15 TaxID=322855 RepID=Q52PN0_9CAUD|nr:hypothetical protein XPXV15_gp01 [Xanthomonas phage Xp15]AAX84846.1 hypothetical protein [Xanthomonas phage Xp15]
MSRKELRTSESEWRRTKHTAYMPKGTHVTRTWRSQAIKVATVIMIGTIITAFWYEFLKGAA